MAILGIGVGDLRKPRIESRTTKCEWPSGFADKVSPTFVCRADRGLRWSCRERLNRIKSNGRFYALPISRAGEQQENQINHCGCNRAKSHRRSVITYRARSRR